MRTHQEHGEACRTIFLNGWKISERILWKMMFSSAVRSGIGKTQYLQSLPEGPEFAKNACEPRLQGLLAGSALVKPYREPKILVTSEGCESRHNHRYAIVVQSLATQWVQAYPWRMKNSQETERSLRKFLEPSEKPKVIYTDNSSEFGKACEELSWNH